MQLVSHNFFVFDRDVHKSKLASKSFVFSHAALKRKKNECWGGGWLQCKYPFSFSFQMGRPVHFSDSQK